MARHYVVYEVDPDHPAPLETRVPVVVREVARGEWAAVFAGLCVEAAREAREVEQQGVDCGSGD